MFITWRIWRILRYPLRQNPVYRRVWSASRPAVQSKVQLHLLLRSLLVLAGVGIMLLLMPFMLVAALVILLLLPLLLLILNGSVLGVYWVTAIADTLAYHWHGGRSILLATTPRGILGLSWLIATVCIHRGDILRTAYRVVRWVIGIVLTLLLFALVIISLQLLDPPLHPGQVRLLIDIVNIMALVVAAWLDHLQSVVVAALVGILAPTYTTQQPLIRITAIGTYLMVQGLFYLVIMVFFLQVQTITLNVIANDITRNLFVTGLSLLVFVLLREGIIVSLWRLMLRRYQATPAEFMEVVS